jgi:hypothetical protein
MCTYSSFLPFFLTVTTIITGGFSAAALDNHDATSSPNIERKIKGGGGGNKVKDSPTVSGSYIVRFDDKTSAAKVKAAATSTATMMQAVKQQLIANGTLQVTANDVINIPSDRIFTNSIKGFLINGVPDAMVSSLLQTPGVTYVEPDRIFTVNSGVKSDSTKSKDETGNQGNQSMQTGQITPWGVTRVGGPINFKTLPNANGKIFVIDTGISPNTNDLNIDSTLSLNFVGLDSITNPGNTGFWADLNGQGTAVAGTIGALDNGIGVVGVVPGASLVAVRVLDQNGKGRISDIIAGVEYVSNIGKQGDVVNMSLGANQLTFPSALNAAVENTASLGLKFAISAGNDGIDAYYASPASASGANIYTVSCYDKTNTLCTFDYPLPASNYGLVVDAAGPGLNIESLARDGSIATWSGTGMAAPHIAGLLFANSFKTAGVINGDKDSKPDPIYVYAGPFVPTPSPAQNTQLVVTIVPDQFSKNETSYIWTKILPTPSVFFTEKVGNIVYPNLYTATFNLAPGTYQFSILDQGGNGLQPPAYYSISTGGKLLKSGGSFGYVDTTVFTVTSTSAEVISEGAPTPAFVVPAPKPVKKAQRPKK